MNTGSRDERMYLADVGRIANALERIAATLEQQTRYQAVSESP